MKPSIGRIVHYVPSEFNEDLLPPGVHCAATVRSVEAAATGSVNLQVLHPLTGVFDIFAVLPDESGGKGTWHWPEREG